MEEIAETLAIDPPKVGEGLEIAAVLLNWNCAAATLKCLASLRASNDVRLTVIIVDNGSTDSSWEELKRAVAEDVVLIQSGANLGYAGGNNIGIRAALHRGVDFVWILNPDTVVHPLCLDEMLKAAEKRPQAGVLVPKILYEESPRTVWYAGGSYDTVRGIPNHWGIGMTDDGRFDVPRQVSFATGCSLLVRREVFEGVGLLDDRYFLYWEDVQFSGRVLDADYEMWTVPTARVWHYDGASAGQVGGRSPTYDYFNLRNRLWYIHEGHRGWRKASAYLWTGPLLIRRFARMVVRREDAKVEKMTAVGRGLRDGILKRPGESGQERKL